MKITQVFNGYCDAEVYGVVVTFELDGKELGSYVNFDRRTIETTSMEFYEGDEAKAYEGVVSNEVADAIALAAREYFEQAIQ